MEDLHDGSPGQSNRLFGESSVDTFVRNSLDTIDSHGVTTGAPPNSVDLSHSEVMSYWRRLGKVLTPDEAALWVRHAAQLPELAPRFLERGITGADALAGSLQERV